MTRPGRRRDDEHSESGGSPHHAAEPPADSPTPPSEPAHAAELPVSEDSVTAAVASEIPGMEDVEDGADSSTEDGAPTPGDSGTAGRPSLR